MEPNLGRERLMSSAIRTPAWQQLQAARDTLVQQHTTIRGEFDSDPLRFDRFSVKTPELVFDYSKNLLTTDIQQLLFDLADQCQLPVAIDNLFAGQRVNTTENRPALHVALRGHAVNGLESEVAEVREKMSEFVGSVLDGNWKGCLGDRITDVVNIGIGGSHLGPAMVVRALENFATGQVRCHFISNVDPAAGLRVLANLNPASTLFIIASKSFSTLRGAGFSTTAASSGVCTGTSWRSAPTLPRPSHSVLPKKTSSPCGTG